MLSCQEFHSRIRDPTSSDTTPECIVRKKRGMKKEERYANSTKAEAEAETETERVKFNLGMTSLPATERTDGRTDADGGAEGGEEVLLSSRLGEWVQNCRFLDKWSR